MRVLLVASLFLVTCFKQSSEPALASSSRPRTIAQVWALTATYEDEAHGVTFRYPKVWEATTQYGYHPPALSGSVDTKPLAGFGYVVGGFPRVRATGPYSRTTVEGFGIGYSAVPAKDAFSCQSKAASVAETDVYHTVTIGKSEFSDYQTSSAGMSQRISGDLYATYIGPTCYLFETGVAEVSIGVVDGVKELTPTQNRYLHGQLFNIMKSVQITKTRD